MKKNFLTVVVLLIALLVSLCNCDIPADAGDLSDGIDSVLSELENVISSEDGDETADEKEEESKQEEPKQEEPKQEEPKQEEPKQEEPKQEEPKQEGSKQEEPKVEPPKEESLPTVNSTFEVHFIDVGQADAALILCDGKAMLIDGGNKGDSNVMYNYLKKHGVTYLD